MKLSLLIPALTAAVSLPCFAASLQGRIVDAVTGTGIPDALVTVGEQVLTANTAGSFPIEGEGQTIAVRAQGYRAARYAPTQVTALHETLPLTPFIPRALYLSVYGIGSGPLREGALRLAHKGFINALVIDVKGDRGLIPYPSAVPLARTDGARQMTTIRSLADLVTGLHRDGLYTIARIVVFKDSPLATARSDLAVHRADGQLYRDQEGLAWTDPFREEVWNYNIAIAREAAEAGFDEVQFDYVRFPDIAASLHFSRAPDETARTEAIEGFLKEARRQLARFNVFVAVDIFGYVCWNANDTGIGQQLENIAAIADYVSPMLYPSCFQYGIPNCRNPVANPYEVIHSTLENAQRRANVPARHFRPWIQAFRDYAFDRRVFDAGAVQSQIQAAADSGSDGWMLWNPRNRYEGLFPLPGMRGMGFLLSPSSAASFGRAKATPGTCDADHCNGALFAVHQTRRPGLPQLRVGCSVPELLMQTGESAGIEQQEPAVIHASTSCARRPSRRDGNS